MPIPVTFTVHYDTHPGEEVCVTGDRQELGHWSVTDAFPLKFVAKGIWQGRVSLAAGKCEYKYIVRRGEMSVWEPSDNHKVTIAEETVFADSWNVSHTVYDTVSNSKLCRDAIFHRGETKKAPVLSPSEDAIILRISIRAPWVAPNETVRIVSDSCPIFGKGMQLHDGDFPIFKREIRLEMSQYNALLEAAGPSALPTITYGFEIVDSSSRVVVSEKTARSITLPRWAKGARIGRVVQMDAGLFRYPTGFNFRSSGVAVPVFSLRSDTSFGCGDFEDLKGLVDFCSETHMHLIQLLPVNDTMIHGESQVHWWDSYPYSPVSVFALHPLYAHIEACVGAGVALPDTVQQTLSTERERLNKLESVDYEAVLTAKLTMLRAIFAEEKEREDVRREIAAFVQENKFWLQPYAVFKALAALHRGTNFREWEVPTHANPSTDFIKGFFESKPDTEMLLVGENTLEEVRFWCWVQMRLFQQVRSAVAYAESHRVGVKGDIPIGCDPNSSDVWAYRGLFKKDAVVGAPPDPFSETGQNWGFPAYDWEAMAADDFKWWKNRLNVMSRYAHAYRIDHVLGFFRIWEIPADRVSGMCGYFVPSRPIHIHELEDRGIWDLDRLCEPYMPERVVRQILGMELYEKFADLMFCEDTERSRGEQHLKFKPEFDTEKKIEAWFAKNYAQETDDEQRIARDHMAALFRITSNVILLRDRNEPDRKFYPRFGLHTTSSFRDLQNFQKQHLHSFCHDYFYRWGDDIFSHSAHSKLPALIEASNGMLVCAEDLGFLSPCVPGTLTHYDILSLIVQRMPSDPNITFSHPNDSKWLSVVTPGTHDMPPLRLWWEQLEPYKKDHYWRHILGRLSAPEMTLSPSDCRAIVDQHMYSPALLAIYPLQDILASWAQRDGDNLTLFGVKLQSPEDERINEPAVRRWKWGWRCPVSLETMNSSSILISELSGLVTDSGRDQYHAKF